MRQYIKKIIPSFRTILYITIGVLTTLNIILAAGFTRISTPSTIQTANDKFPIESFVMVTQDIQFYEVVCGDDEVNCAPQSFPTAEMIATGSGVIIGQYKGSSLVLTAGHVCSAPGNGTPVTENVGIQYKMHLESGFGREGFGTILAVDSTNDLCVLIADTHLGPGLEVSDGDPTLHEEVYTMSSPRALAVPLAVPVFDGYFTGQVSDIYIFTIPAAPGSSGSPILNEHGEIISIISSAAISFDEFTIGCRTPALRNFVLAVRASL